MSWFVYLVRCRDGSLYTGITTDPRSRLRAHNSGRGAKYTRARRPVTLVHVERAAGHAAALRREWTIKQWPRARKARLLAAGGSSVSYSLPAGTGKPRCRISASMRASRPRKAR